MKKIVLLLSALCFLCSTAFAGFNVVKSGYIPCMMKRDKIKKVHVVDRNFRYSPYFSQEKASDLNFNAIVDSDTLPQKVSFSKGWKDKWSKRIAMSEIYDSFSTMQVQDQATGKLLYTIGRGTEAYVLGYEPSTKKAIVYFDSTQFSGPYTNPWLKDLLVKNGQLYLEVVPDEVGMAGSHVAYRLFWDAKANWVGYEYIGSFRR